jgi:hypothetical protein
MVVVTAQIVAEEVRMLQQIIHSHNNNVGSLPGVGEMLLREKPQAQENRKRGLGRLKRPRAAPLALLHSCLKILRAAIA